MRSKDIAELLKQRPFKAFRLYILESRVYEVHHPDQIVVGRSAVRMGSPTGHPEIEDVIIALIHITRIEVIAPATAPSSN